MAQIHPTEKIKTSTRHYHVSVGPPEVNIYNLKGLTFGGPYYDVIFESVDDAVRAWAGLANEIAQTYIHKEVYIENDDVEGLIEDISGMEWSFTYEDGMPNVEYEFGDEEQLVALADCGGCFPRSNN